MAFCPHCGKPTTKEATKCIACGKEIGPAKKARFAGTMMLSSNDAAVEAGLRAAPPKSAQPASVPAPPMAPPPAAAAPAPAAVPAPAPKKLAATMIGTGIPGASGSLPGVPQGAPPAEPMMRNSEQLADTAPRNTDDAHAAPAKSAAVEGAGEAKFLVGDPMAPAPSAQAPRKGGATPHGEVDDSTTRLLMVVLFGLAIIGGLGYAAASFLGLL